MSRNINIDPQEKINIIKAHYSGIKQRYSRDHAAYFTKFKKSESNDGPSPVQRIDLYKKPDLSSYISLNRKWNICSFVHSKADTVLCTTKTSYHNDWSQNRIQQFHQNKNTNNVSNSLNEMLAKPVDISKGKSMLEKMGWKGGGLGKYGGGILEPITPEATYATATIGFGHGAQYKEPKGEEFDDNFRTNVLLIIFNFVRNEQQSDLEFDNTLLNTERKRIHTIVEDLRVAKSVHDIYYDKELDTNIAKNILESNSYLLFTKSYGDAKNRQLFICKDAPPHIYLIVPDDLRENEIEKMYLEMVFQKNKKKFQKKNKSMTKVQDKTKKSHNKKLSEEKKEEEGSEKPIKTVDNLEVFQNIITKKEGDQIINKEIIKNVVRQIEDNEQVVEFEGQIKNNDYTETTFKNTTVEKSHNDTVKYNENESSDESNESEKEIEKVDFVLKASQNNDEHKNEDKPVDGKNCEEIADNEIVNNEMKSGKDKISDEKTQKDNTEQPTENNKGDAEKSQVSIENECLNNKESQIKKDNNAEESENYEVHIKENENVDNKLSVVNTDTQFKNNLIGKEDEDKEIGSNDCKTTDSDALKTCSDAANIVQEVSLQTSDKTNKANIDTENRTSDQILPMIIEFFKEFTDKIAYTELRFLGTFNDEETEAIKLFFNIFINQDFSAVNDKLSEVLKSDSYEFIVKTNSNGNRVIEKKKREDSEE